MPLTAFVWTTVHADCISVCEGQFMMYCGCVKGTTVLAVLHLCEGQKMMYCGCVKDTTVHAVLHLCERQYMMYYSCVNSSMYRQISVGKRLRTLPFHPTLGEPPVAVFFSWRTPTNKWHLAKFERHQSHLGKRTTVKVFPCRPPQSLDFITQTDDSHSTEGQNSSLFGRAILKHS